MDMIRHSAKLSRVQSKLSDLSSDPALRLRSDLRRLQKWTAIFGGENNVNQDQGEGLSHAVTTQYLCVVAMLYLAPLSGRATLGGRFPGLKPWAESSCPYRSKIIPSLIPHHSALSQIPLPVDLFEFASHDPGVDIDAAPIFYTNHPLIDQHAKAVHDLAAARFRIDDQMGARWAGNNVGDYHS